MPVPHKWKEHEVKQVAKMLEGGANKCEVARVLGVGRDKVRNLVTKLESSGLDGTLKAMGFDKAIEHPVIPSSNRSAKELVELAKREHERRRINNDARRMQKVKVKMDGPVGIFHMGDPHVDDAGCNWTRLDNDIALVRETKGMFSGCVGDYTNNWVGRLMKLYRHSLMTQGEAHKLVEYVFGELNDKWLYLVMGNHDHWNTEGGNVLELIKRLSQVDANMEAHDATLCFSFPNGNEATLRARHRFKGNSEINKLHGQVKSARFGFKYDITVEGDRHTSAYHVEPFPTGGVGFQAGQGIECHMLQLGAYKEMDDFAEEIGFENQNMMPSLVTIINPYIKTTTGKVTTFSDVGAACDYLTWLRQRWERGRL